MMWGIICGRPKGCGPSRHCEPQAKQSKVAWLPLDCFVASLLARTASVWVLIKETWYKSGDDPAIQTPKAAIWMPGSIPGL